MAIILSMIGVLVGAAAIISWIESGAPSPLAKPVPQWITPGEVRATTRDGTLVKARVALDAVNASSRSAVERRLQPVGLMLELSISSLNRDELAEPKGIPRLAHDMRQRINAYLVSEGVEPLRSVAIQDLLYKDI